MPECRYIGAYGRGHHRAYIPDVGEVFYGQVIEVTDEQFKKLPRHEWVLVDSICFHTGMDGALCWNKRVEGSKYCALHLEEFSQRAILEPEQSDDSSVELSTESSIPTEEKENI